MTDPSTERVLATVLFTDIVDSTQRLSEMGDQRWGALLERHHEVVRKELAGHGGREVSTTGDGFVAVFDSPAQAIRCALAIRDALEPLRIQVRAGLHSGEIERHGDQIGGIAVHTAARVAALGGAGEILISRTVRDLVSGGGFHVVDLGERKLKGVPERWRVFRVDGDERSSSARTSGNSPVGLWSRMRDRPWLPAAAAGILLSLVLAAFVYRDRLGTAADEAERQAPARGADVAQASIAVLPFDNMSADAENEYFADGLAEEILNALAHVPGLKVAARTSSFSFKDRDADIPTIAAALGVRTVLEGSVRKSGERVRITAQLVNAADGLHLWSETYDRDLDDIFVVQEEIARAIVEALEVRLTTGGALVERPTGDQEAYEEYLRGRFLWNQRTPEALEAAISHFERAVERDPDFTLAWAGLADAILTLPWYVSEADWDSLLQSGREAAERALELDPNLGQAHATLGIYHAEKFEWDAADEEFRRAFELDPEYSTVHYWYAFTIISQNRIDDAIEHARIAAELDPLSLVNVRGYGFILMWAGRYEEALDQLDRVRELDPNFTPNWGAYARIYTVLGRWPEATEAFVRFAELRGWDPEAFRHATAAMERHAKEGRPVPIPADLEVAVPRSMLRAEIVAMLGQPDSAMAILERMYEDGDPNLREAGIHPMLASLHDDARFVALLERIGLTPVPAARTWMNDR
ncbi:MAG TPA: adenylate/guanylate cyclase domain-containing protein [Gemmatimonadota bacterium]|nr:adenylate/guanylate cyclase domain-containing protein [Gemmatimonadota bacterium]